MCTSMQCTFWSSWHARETEKRRRRKKTIHTHTLIMTIYMYIYESAIGQASSVKVNERYALHRHNCYAISQNLYFARSLSVSVWLSLFLSFFYLFVVVFFFGWYVRSIYIIQYKRCDAFNCIALQWKWTVMPSANVKKIHTKSFSFIEGAMRELLLSFSYCISFVWLFSFATISTYFFSSSRHMLHMVISSMQVTIAANIILNSDGTYYIIIVHATAWSIIESRSSQFCTNNWEIWMNLIPDI